MAGLGSVITQIGNAQNTVASISIDESIGGILFDISGFNSPFDDYSLINSNFGDNQVELINNMDDAENLGLCNEGFMNGLVYYHLSMFYKFISGNAPLYIAFFNSDNGWGYIETMQRLTYGKIFQLGIWTSKPIWAIEESNVKFTSLISDVQGAVNELNGEIGTKSQSPIPLNVVLSANSYYISNTSVKLNKLPNAVSLEAPNVSMLISQDNSDDVLNIQSQNPLNAPVGSIGFAMAVLSLAGAEECMGSIQKFNINKDDCLQTPEIPVGNKHNLVDDVSRIILNILATYGYIVPITYDAKEGEVFFSGDPTLSSGDYCTIANNRVIHKCRRAIISALIPYINSDFMYSESDKGLNNIAVALFEELIGSTITGKIVNKEGQYQVSGYKISSIESENILNDDTVNIKYTVSPVNYNGTITDNVSIG